jgi:4-hydroxyphenylpyruvate dioxygenase-like putative hemolysin
LIDTSQYSGSSLPGFIPVLSSEISESHQRLISGIDHIAFAMQKNSAFASVIWYEKVFGMKRFILNQ